MKVKLLLIVVAIIAVSSIEWMLKKLSNLVISQFGDSEEV